MLWDQFLWEQVNIAYLVLVGTVQLAKLDKTYSISVSALSFCSVRGLMRLRSVGLSAGLSNIPDKNTTYNLQLITKKL